MVRIWPPAPSAGAGRSAIFRRILRMNALDLIVIAGVALSALLAFARGFVREALAIGAWIGAGLATLYGLPHARPFVRQFIASPWLGDIAAGIAIFIGSLILLSVLTSMIAGRVKHSALSAVDRALGLLFGVARGIVIACLAFIALGWAIQEPNWPLWVRDARTRPFLSQGAEVLKSLVPAAARERSAAAASRAQQSYQQAREAEALLHALETPAPAISGAKPTSAAPASAYKPTQLREMDQLIESVKDK